MEGINFINSGVASVIYNVLIPKLFPSTMVDKISSGMEIQRDIVETGIPNTVEQTRERPVIPPRCQSGRGEEEINRNSGNGSSKRDPSVILHQCQDGAFFKRTLSGRVLCIIQDRIFLLLHRLRLCISSHQLLLHLDP